MPNTVTYAAGNNIFIDYNAFWGLGFLFFEDTPEYGEALQKIEEVDSVPPRHSLLLESDPVICKLNYSDVKYRNKVPSKKRRFQAISN